MSDPGQVPITILIIDDHPVYRDGLRMLFGGLEGVEVICEGGSGEEAVLLAEEYRPDVVLMDIHMPGMDGIEATRFVIQASPGTRVLMLTMVDEEETVFSAMKAGSRGYVLKTADEAEILGAVRAVMDGQIVYSPSLAKRIADYFSATRPATLIPANSSLSSLERQILRLLANGYDDSAVSRVVGADKPTVQECIAQILEKLQLEDRARLFLQSR